MIIYWLLLFIAACFALRFSRTAKGDFIALEMRYLFDALIFVLILILGFRFEVGGDWNTYLYWNNRLYGKSLAYVFEEGNEIGFELLNWLGANFIGGLFLPQLVCGMLLLIGLRKFCFTLPNPFLGLTIAMPYLIWVVGQGYTRQAAALGFFLFGLSYVSVKKTLSYTLCSGMGLLFHKTAVLFIPFAMFINDRLFSRTFLISFIVISITSLLAYITTLSSGDVIAMFDAYLGDSNISSAGALIRCSLTATTGTIFLYNRKRFVINSEERVFWSVFSLVGIMIFALIFISPSSTVIDRINVYWLPLQIFVLTSFPTIFESKYSNSRQSVTLVIILLCALIQWIWMFYSGNAAKWLPYRFYIWEWIWNSVDWFWPANYGFEKGK